jgi:hypothetical protein
MKQPLRFPFALDGIFAQCPDLPCDTSRPKILFNVFETHSVCQTKLSLFVASSLGSRGTFSRLQEIMSQKISILKIATAASSSGESHRRGKLENIGNWKAREAHCLWHVLCARIGTGD